VDFVKTVRSHFIDNIGGFVGLMTLGYKSSLQCGDCHAGEEFKVLSETVAHVLANARGALDLDPAYSTVFR
jgi:hypothetical protein